MSNVFWPWNATFALSLQATRMCWEAQTVMFLRCLRIAQGGAKAETARMMTEKIAALAEAQVATTAAALTGSRTHGVAKKALGVYAKRVRRNKRRLSK
jgi:hypothetical protein